MYNNGHFAHKICAGIDKLCISTPDFSIRNASKIKGFRLKPHYIDLNKTDFVDTLLFCDKSGKSYSGQSAYLNNEYYCLNINTYGLQVVFNPSKAYHPFNLCDNQKMLSRRIRAVIKQVEKLGISSDWEKSIVTRTDVAKNALMKQPIIAYNPIFSWLQLPFSKKSALYPDGYTSGNNQFSVNIYNKGMEMRYKKIDDIQHDNLMRLEMQFKTRQAVWKKLELLSLKDFLNNGVEVIQAAFKQILYTEVFRINPKQMPLEGKSYEDHLMILKELKTLYPRRALNMHVQVYGVKDLMADIGGIELYKQLLKDAGYHRNSPNNQIHKIKKLMNLTLYRKSNTGIGKLYSEMYRKFAA